MAIYRCWHGGDNTGGANNANWAQAYNTLIGALTAAASPGDIVYVHYTHTESFGVSWTGTVAAGVEVRAVDKDSAEAYRPQASDGYITNTTNVFLVQNDKSRVNGLSLRIVSAGNGRTMGHRTANNAQASAKDMSYLQESTNANSTLVFNGTGDVRGGLTLYQPQIKLSNASQAIWVSGVVNIVGGALVSGSSAITNVFRTTTASDANGGTLYACGLDLSNAASSATLLADPSTGVTPLYVRLAQCSLPGSFTLLGSLSGTGDAGAVIELNHCFTASVDEIWAYANSQGSIVKDTGITFTGETYSWRITTTAACTRMAPFVTPWLTWLDPPASAITCRFEVLRDGSSTAYTDAEVWAEFDGLETAGAALRTDEAAVGAAGSAQAAGAGTGSWAGEGGTAWSGKLEAPSALTPRAGSSVLGRIVAAIASATLFASPTIRA